MKKRSVVLLATVMSMALLLQGCGKEAGTSETNGASHGANGTEQGGSQSTEQTNDGTEQIAASPILTMSDNLLSYQFSMNGYIYQLPMTYQEFVSSGWTYDETAEDAPESDIVEPDHSVGLVFRYSNGESIQAEVTNFAINGKAIEECYITYVRIDEYSFRESQMAVELPGGLKMNVSEKKDMKKAYGDPESEIDRGVGIEYQYGYDGFSEANLLFSSDTKKLSVIKLKNRVIPDGFDVGTIQSGAPDILATYQAPIELGNNLKDMNISYDGILCQFPAPLSLFLSNGWTMEEGSDTTMSGSGDTLIRMFKGDYSILYFLKNYSNDACAIEDTYVYGIYSQLNEYSNNCAGVPTELACGITLGMSEDDLKNALQNEPYDAIDYGDYIQYSLFYDDVLEYRFEVDDGQVSKIEMYNNIEVQDYRQSKGL